MTTPMQASKTLDKIFILLLALVVHLSIPWHEGIKFCDSATYVYAAKQFVANQSINHQNIYSSRVMVWLPYAAYIFFFGVNNYITWVATLELCVLLCTVYFLLRNYQQRVAIYSAAFLGFSTLMIREGTETMGDILLTLLINLPVLIYWRYIKNGEYPQAFKYGIIAGVCWVLAFYTKESAVYYLIVCLCFSALAWHKKLKHDIRFWCWFWLVLLLSAIATLWFYYAQTGDPFHKLMLINKNITAHAASSFHRVWKTHGELLCRLTFQPVVFFTYDHAMGLLGMLAVFYLVHSRKSPDAFWRWYLLVPLAVWWLFPQKLVPYYPMWLTHRLWLPLMVPLAICAAHGMKVFTARQETKPERILLIVIGISLVIIPWIFFGIQDPPDKKRVVLYGMVVLFLMAALCAREDEISRLRKAVTTAVLFFTFLAYASGRFPEWGAAAPFFLLLAFVIHESKSLRKIALIVVMAPSLYYNIDRFFWTRQKSDFSQVKELIEFVNNKKGSGSPVVLASSCFVEYTRLFDRGNLHFFPYEDDRANNIRHDVYLILDMMLVNSKYLSKGAEEAYKNLPGTSFRFETQPEELGFALLKEDERYRVYYRQ